MDHLAFFHQTKALYKYEIRVLFPFKVLHIIGIVTKYDNFVKWNALASLLHFLES